MSGRPPPASDMTAQQYISTSFSIQQSYRPFELQQTRPTPVESLPDRGTVHEIMQNIWALDWTSTPAWDTHTMARVFLRVYMCKRVYVCVGPWLTGCWHILITLGSCCFWPQVAGCGSSTSHILRHYSLFSTTHGVFDYDNVIKKNKTTFLENDYH